jgi:VIT1/CCC1 family predicted Fe2+/Mn2+ transporter
MVDKELLQQQKNEITEHHVYLHLAKRSTVEQNAKVLRKIAADEYSHYTVWKEITGQDVKPKRMLIWWYTVLSFLFGLAFTLKLMEGGEANAQRFYERITAKYPQAKKIQRDEKRHEKNLIALLEDQRLKYASAIVLGLNDALVELTGTLAGLTLAFRNTQVIGITGLIMGIAASLSMAASGYLSSREEDHSNEEVNPITSAIYTGVAYIVTVGLLVAPYFLVENVFVALGSMLTITVLIIAGYTFYISVAKELRFRTRFLEMALISFSVAIISFAIGYVLKHLVGVDV